MPRSVLNTYLSQSVPFVGGIRRDIDKFIPGSGWWTLTGCHTNVLDTVTKLSGYQVTNTLAGSIQGLYQARLNNTPYQFAFEGGRVQWLNQPTGTLLAQGLSSSGLVSGGMLQSQFYFCNGVDENKKIVLVNGLPTVYKMGITPPSTGPTAATGASGGLTGTYSYKYTFYNSLQDIESDPSPQSNNLTVSNQAINLSGIATSTDPQVTARRLYRTTNGGSLWQLVTTINDNTTTTYTDTLPDGSLGAQVREDNGVPPIAKYLTVWNGMVVLAGLAAPLQSTVAASGVLRPEGFDVDNQYDLDPQEADVITGVSTYGSNLVVAKRYGLYLGSGVDPTNLSFLRTRVSQGVLSHWSIIPYASALFYAGERGFYAFQGLQEEYISRPIEDIYRNLQFDQLAKCVGFYYPHLNILVWTVAQSGSSIPTNYLIYNIVLKEWTTSNVDATWVSSYIDTSNRLRWWVGTSTGNIGNGDTGYTQAGAPMTMDLITRGVALDQPIPLLKDFRHLVINYDPNGGTATVTVSVSADSPDGPFTTIGSFTPTTGDQVSFNFHTLGHLLFIRLTTTSGEALVIRQITVYGKVLGRQRGWR